MIKVLDNVLTDEEMESILNHENVLRFKGLPQKRTNFDHYLDPAIVDKLNKALDIELDPTQPLPLKWIHGDTGKHFDRDCDGKQWMSYVLYFTDNKGKFTSRKTSYDVKKGRCFILEPGIIHETKGSDTNPKLSIVIDRHGREMY
jgi:hypothetical protein